VRVEGAVKGGMGRWMVSLAGRSDGELVRRRTQYYEQV